MVYEYILIDEIISIFDKKKVKESGEIEQEIKKVFEKHFKQENELSEDEFNKKWEKSKFFVKELAKIKCINKTTFIEVSSNKTTYVFNINEIKHNEKWILLFIILNNIWECKFELTERKATFSNVERKDKKQPFIAALEEAGKQDTRYIYLVNIYINDNQDNKYSYYRISPSIELFDNDGGNGVGTKVRKFEGIVY